MVRSINFVENLDWSSLKIFFLSIQSYSCVHKTELEILLKEFGPIQLRNWKM
jgi:hypothetical protein